MRQTPIDAPMLTFFAVPKPFRDHIGTIQRNAIQSWARAYPGCEVILFGAEEGIAEAATRLGVAHVRHVAKNEFGTPLLNDVFEKAQRRAGHDIMCYVNADIILTGDLIPAVRSVATRKKTFLMMGCRIDIDIDGPLDFCAPDWQDRIRRYARESGKRKSPEWIDYFVFPRGLYQSLPPFAIGRAAFDNWLLWKAHSSGAALVDASDAVMAIHQNHDYRHHPQGQKGVWEGPEARRNRQLMGAWSHCFFISDATHRLGAAGLKRNITSARICRKMDRMRRALRELSSGGFRQVRHRLGLKRSSLGFLFSVLRRVAGRRERVTRERMTRG